MTFDRACELVAEALAGDARRAILADLPRAADMRTALLHLRDGMRTHAWKANGRRVNLAAWVAEFDARTRADGFHVLHDWDGIADRVNDDIIPVDVLNYLVERRGAEPPDAAALAILLDYYFLHLLALLSLRVWDDGDPDANLDRLSGLLAEVQGPGGSGQRFARSAETLLLIATSHYEPREDGYGSLLARTRTLSRPHQVSVAIGHAASMGCHLRFGFEATYGRDTANMRNDNVADYPWLLFAVSTVMQEYARLREQGVEGPSRETVVEALLCGLSPDARALVGDRAPESLASCEPERAGFLELFQRWREDLLQEFEKQRPTDRQYSPLSFFFNFSHNVLKGAVVDALLWGQPWPLALDDLLTGVGRDDVGDEPKLALARTLMAYARSNPNKIRGRLRPVIVYDPQAGRQAFSVTLRKLKE